MATVSLRLHKKGVGMFVSPLEEQILKILWKKKSCRVRDVHAHLNSTTALTSVAVSLDRLHKRKAVGRRVETGRGGPHYIYHSLSSKDGFERSLIDSAVNSLIGNFGDVAVSYFNDRFGKREK